MDEAAGKARLAMREASRSRRQEAHRETMRQSTLQRASIKNAVAVTDISINDEEAGRYRSQRAQEAQERRRQEVQALRLHAARAQARISAARSLTEADLTDEAVGQWRVELAQTSEEQRLERSRQLAKKNAAMRQKLVATPPRVLKLAFQGEGGLAQPIADDAMTEAVLAAAAAKEEVARAKDLIRLSLLSDQARVQNEAYAKRSAPATLW